MQSTKTMELHTFPGTDSVVTLNEMNRIPHTLSAETLDELLFMQRLIVMIWWFRLKRDRIVRVRDGRQQRIEYRSNREKYPFPRYRLAGTGPHIVVC